LRRPSEGRGGWALRAPPGLLQPTGAGARPAGASRRCADWKRDRRRAPGPRPRGARGARLRRGRLGERARMAASPAPGRAAGRRLECAGRARHVLGDPRLPGGRLRRRLPAHPAQAGHSPAGRGADRDVPAHADHGRRDLGGRDGPARSDAQPAEPAHDHGTGVRGPSAQGPAAARPSPGACGSAGGRPQEGRGPHPPPGRPSGPCGDLRLAPPRRRSHPAALPRPHRRLGRLQPWHPAGGRHGARRRRAPGARRRAGRYGAGAAPERRRCAGREPTPARSPLRSPGRRGKTRRWWRGRGGRSGSRAHPRGRRRPGRRWGPWAAAPSASPHGSPR